MLSLLLDCLFPHQSSLGCDGNVLSTEERSQLCINPVFEHCEELREHGILQLDSVVAASSYVGRPLLKKAIHAVKYWRQQGLCTLLGQMIVEAVQNEFDEDLKFVLCPVPLHWTRRFERGFNQAQLLADTIGTTLQMPVAKLLRRIRPTGHQAHRSREDRLTAVATAFRAKSSVPTHVILIDDVMTTGATLNACAQALKQAGAERVEAWVVAHDRFKF